MVACGSALAISIILVLMSLVFAFALKVTPGRVVVADAVVVGAWMWKDSPAPLPVVPMVRAPRFGAVAKGAAGGVAVAGSTRVLLAVVTAAGWRFAASVAVVA